MTFESSNTTDETVLRFYHFEFDDFGSPIGPLEFLSMNTLPSNASNLCFPGFFHSEPNSRLTALKVLILDVTTEDILLRVLYVPHDVLLAYIRSHSSDTDTVVVPWEAWGPGNAHILTPPLQPPTLA